MYENLLAERLTYLRERKGVSARDMSISIGQNPGYINGIENRRALPSMTVFYYICEYLGVTPSEFFDEGNRAPERLKQIMEELKRLGPDKLEHLALLIADIKD